MLGPTTSTAQEHGWTHGHVDTQPRGGGLLWDCLTALKCPQHISFTRSCRKPEGIQPCWAPAALREEPQAALAFLSCCTQGPARATQPKARPQNMCLPSLFPASRPNLPSTCYSCKRFLSGIGICVIQAELWHKPPLGTATMDLWQLPIPKGCQHGKTQNTEVWGVPAQMQKCQHSKPARKGRGEKRLQLPKSFKKNSLSSCCSSS